MCSPTPCAPRCCGCAATRWRWWSSWTPSTRHATFCCGHGARTPHRRRGSVPSTTIWCRRGVSRPDWASYWRRSPASGPDQPRDRLGRLLDFRAGVATVARRVHHAVCEVAFEQADGYRLQCPGRRGDLGEDVDAVLIVLDHPVYATDLALDPLEAAEQGLLLGAVPVPGVGLVGRGRVVARHGCQSYPLVLHRAHNRCAQVDI